jgi:hypothetical protein
MTKIDVPTCSECKQLHCYRHDKRYPKHCLTTALDKAELAELAARYAGADAADSLIAHAAAEVEGLYYGKTWDRELELARRGIGAVLDRDMSDLKYSDAGCPDR